MLDRILCIDDDPITLMLCKKGNCEDYVFHEIISSKWREALKYFDDLQDIDLSTIELPKLIFLDLNMPVMGGWEF
jgi:CheY-like chemotaxis protein